MIRNEMLFLEDILDSISNIEKFSKDLSKEKFLKNELKQSAIIRQIEIIGEAVKNISDKTKDKYPQIEWKKIAGSRDIFIHAYFEVNLERIWDILKKDLPNLKEKILKIKTEVEAEGKEDKKGKKKKGKEKVADAG